jgi:bifunctional isochorismate lyase/aryl carrier protein
MPQLENPWEAWLANQIGSLLSDPAYGVELVAQRASDLFAAGLDSVRTFALLDELADAGVDLDFGIYVTSPSVDHLLAAIDGAGVAAP